MSETPGPDATLERWLEALAAPSAAPGGGAAAALALALAAALVEMVAGLTLRRGQAEGAGDVPEAVRRGAELRSEALALARADAEAFAGFERALGLPRSTAEERETREQAKRAAYRQGARVQHDLLGRSAEVAALASTLSRHGLTSARGDAGTALQLARAVARSAEASVRVDLASEGDDEARRMLAASALLLADVEAR